MKPYVHNCIRRWRGNNPEKYREAITRHAKTRLAWQSISTEFRHILISEHIPDYKETRGRKPSTFKNPLLEKVEQKKS